MLIPQAQSREEIAELIRSGDEELFRWADAERGRSCSDEVHLRAIVELSNHCSRDCAYCGLRRSNRQLPRYRMSDDEVLEAAAEAADQGFGTIVLQSGESDAERAELLATLISSIKSSFDVALTLCVGVKPDSFYKACREAGADRCLVKHECASPELYDRHHADSSLGERVHALVRLRGLGYQTGCGAIIGLPGQNARDIADDILLARWMEVDMAAFGPLVPHPQTPLAHVPAGDIETSLRVVAVARLVLGPVHLPATTALDAISHDGRERALRSGANVIMANMTPERYQRLYDLYPGRQQGSSAERIRSILKSVGRPSARGQGHSLLRPPPCPSSPHPTSRSPARGPR